MTSRSLRTPSRARRSWRRSSSRIGSSASSAAVTRRCAAPRAGSARTRMRRCRTCRSRRAAPAGASWTTGSRAPARRGTSPCASPTSWWRPSSSPKRIWCSPSPCASRACSRGFARAQRGGAAGGLPGVHDVADLAPAPQAGAGARLAARAAPRGGRGRERGARSETGEETTRAMTVARGARLGGVRPQRRMTGRLQRLEQPQRRAHNGTVIAHRRVPGACPFCLPTPRTGH